ncbi:MAG: glutathione peroxidase [Rhodospirillales bacterium]
MLADGPTSGWVTNAGKTMLTRLTKLAAGALLLSASATGAYAELSDQPFDWSEATLTGLHGEPLPASLFEGKTVLVVNTASQCGFTPQYAGLQALWERYGDRGFVVLGVPANDFGRQEPGSNAEIAGFCERRFAITFPMTEKTTVVGAAAHPIFAWAARVSDGKANPQWNFYKLLIDRDGKLDSWFTSLSKPESKSVTARIEAVLAR